MSPKENTGGGAPLTKAMSSPPMPMSSPLIANTSSLIAQLRSPIEAAPSGTWPTSTVRNPSRERRVARTASASTSTITPVIR